MRVFFTAFALILLISMASALVIRIEIAERVELKPIFIDKRIANNLVTFSFELYNTGSITYFARIRMDIFNENKSLIYTGWSEEKVITPGKREVFEIYFYSKNLTGNFSFLPRFYYGNEIMEGDERNFTVLAIEPQAAAIKIEDLRTYEKYLKFSLKTNQSLTVALIPSGYTQGMIFEQKKISLQANRRTQATLGYKAAILPTEISITAVSEDGKSAITKNFKLMEERGLLKYLHFLFDWLKILFNI